MAHKVAGRGGDAAHRVSQNASVCIEEVADPRKHIRTWITLAIQVAIELGSVDIELPTDFGHGWMISAQQPEVFAKLRANSDRLHCLVHTCHSLANLWLIQM